MGSTMKKTILLIFATSSLLLSGCVISIDEDDFDGDYGSHSSWQKEQRENRKLIDRLVLGESKTEVMARMGSAAFNEALLKDDTEYQLLWYRTQHNRSDGVTTKDECTPLVFKNEELVGWGQTALDLL